MPKQSRIYILYSSVCIYLLYILWNKLDHHNTTTNKFSHEIRSNTCLCRIINVEFLPYMAIAESPQQVEIVLKIQQRASIKKNPWGKGVLDCCMTLNQGRPPGLRSYTKYFYAIEKTPFFYNLLKNKKY